MAKTSQPKHCIHRGVGQSYVKINGRQIFTGTLEKKKITEAAAREYRRILTEHLANQDRPTKPDSATVDELFVRFLRDKVGMINPRTVESYKLIIADILKIYSGTLAVDFDIAALKTCRDAFIKRGLCRQEVNKRTNAVKTIFRHSISEGLIPAEVLDGLKYIEPLRYGQCNLPEGKPRKAIASDVFEKTLAELAPTWQKIARLQLATGARPSEILHLKIQEIDKDNPELWIADLRKHKNAHRGQIKLLHFAKPEIIILQEVIGDRSEGYVFNPAMLVSDDKANRAAKAAPRKKQPSRVKRDAARAKNKKRKICEVIDQAVYRRAISRAIERAGVPKWNPYDVRHTTCTKIAIEKGLDTARAVLGQKTISVTIGYNHGDSAIAAAVALERNKPQGGALNAPPLPDASSYNALLAKQLQEKDEQIKMLLAALVQQGKVSIESQTSIIR